MYITILELFILTISLTLILYTIIYIINKTRETKKELHKTHKENKKYLENKHNDFITCYVISQLRENDNAR